ncbi:hypothetical protein [Faucicola boevrei]|uniref:hypothetical protein n=1 Tax=Faucicola boevrei TaxID=346665 RepID=UPI00035C1BB0|nr:hypothetical protein [Moraxella boevrei]
MSILVFNTESEFKNDAIALVSRLAFEKAIPVISNGCVADESEQALSYLLDLAKENKIDKKSIDAIAFYHRQILDENQEMLKHY